MKSVRMCVRVCLKAGRRELAKGWCEQKANKGSASERGEGGRDGTLGHYTEEKTWGGESTGIANTRSSARGRERRASSSLMITKA